MRSSRIHRTKTHGGFNKNRATPQPKIQHKLPSVAPPLAPYVKAKLVAKPPAKTVQNPVPPAELKPDPPLRRRGGLRDRILNAVGRDITSAVTNKTKVQLKKEKQNDELRSVDPADIREAMRPMRPGERLYNSLVSSKKTRKKRLPASVRLRVERTKEMLDNNPHYPEEVMNAIHGM